MRDLIFIVLDSFRGDVFQNQGKEISPELWALQADFANFYQAHTTSSWSLPSHTTLFTGLYASEHGKHSGAIGSDIRLDTSIFTLAEICHKKGFETAGFSSNPWVGASSGLNRGFDFFVEHDFRVTQAKRDLPATFRVLRNTAILNRKLMSNRLAIFKRPFVSGKMTDGLIDFLEQVPPGQNLFGFINLMDPHHPYQPKRALLQKYGSSGELLPERIFNRQLNHYVGGENELSAALLRNLWAYYYASLEHASRQTLRILETLKSTGRYDEALIFILSDHGKTLGEYPRRTFPLHYMCDENSRILLLAKLPDLPAGKHAEAVSLIDCYYSALRGIGEQKNPNFNLSRVALEDRIENRDWIPNETLIPFSGPETKDPDLVQSLTNGRFKYLRSAKHQELLWDSERTGSEIPVDCKSDFPDVVVEARHHYDRWQDSLVTEADLDRQQPYQSDGLNPALVQRLKDLGYF